MVTLRHHKRNSITQASAARCTCRIFMSPPWRVRHVENDVPSVPWNWFSLANLPEHWDSQKSTPLIQQTCTPLVQRSESSMNRGLSQARESIQILKAAAALTSQVVNKKIKVANLKNHKQTAPISLTCKLQSYHNGGRSHFKLSDIWRKTCSASFRQRDATDSMPFKVLTSKGRNQCVQLGRLVNGRTEGVNGKPHVFLVALENFTGTQ